jgi:uncharacterized protein YqgV (UPF0045/DUF77 family)
LFNLTMFPVGAGDALVEPVADVIDEISRAGLSYEVNGAATVIEGDWDRVVPVIHRAFARLRGYNNRVFLALTVDDHAGVRDRIHEAVTDIERALHHSIPHRNVETVRDAGGTAAVRTSCLDRGTLRLDHDGGVPAVETSGRFHSRRMVTPVGC